MILLLFAVRELLRAIADRTRTKRKSGFAWLGKGRRRGRNLRSRRRGRSSGRRSRRTHWRSVRTTQFCTVQILETRQGTGSQMSANKEKKISFSQEQKIIHAPLIVHVLPAHLCVLYLWGSLFCMGCGQPGFPIRERNSREGHASWRCCRRRPTLRIWKRLTISQSMKKTRPIAWEILTKLALSWKPLFLYLVVGYWESAQSRKAWDVKGVLVERVAIRDQMFHR